MTNDLKRNYETAEREAQAIQADRDADLVKLRKKYDDKLRKANDQAAALQKQWLDAEAAGALVGRDDAQAIADNLGLTLPDG